MTQPSTDSPLRVALCGAGRVGTAVAKLLAEAGHRVVAVTSRTEESADRSARFLGSDPIEWGTSLPPVDLVLLGVTDAALDDAVEALGGTDLTETTVVHFAGVVGIEPLEPLTARGAMLAALHPVQACPTVEAAIARLPGSAWGVTCSPGLREWCFALIEAALAGSPVEVAEGDRAVWHAAAVTVSNGAAALLAAGEAMLDSIGIGTPEAVLGPLAEGTMRNAVEGGGGGSTLTGPLIRGDRVTIDRHRSALAAHDELRHLYDLVAVLIAEAAIGAGRIDRSEWSGRAEVELG